MSWLREADAEPIPGYRLIRPLGSGGFGEVWLCEAPGKIHKAIKFVFGSLDASATGDGRARQEFGAIQRVKEVRHPFVISIERIDIIDNEVVMVMELADKSLHDVLVEMKAAGKPGIPREMLLSYLSDAADGLDFLSEAHNLLHLDVKPKNLFLIGNHVKVADFGLAKHLERQSSSGVMAGISPQYSAPETFTSRITKFSDQYSLAIVYAELLTGQRPFKGKTIRELALQHMSMEPNLSMLPECDRKAVAKALDKEPVKRFPSCKAFIQALSGIVGGGGGSAIAIPDPVSLEQNDYINTPATIPLQDKAAPALQSTTPVIAKKLRAAETISKALDELPIAEPYDSSVEDSQLINFNFPENDGVLRPTLVIGLGQFGLLGLRELRSRLTDRLGDPKQIPSIRFLYVDADPNAATTGIAGSPDRALNANEIFPTPLQPVTRYRKAALDLLNEWLPREKLHAIPRTLDPEHTRGLGRLAYSENYLRLITRIRRELEIACHPESLSRSGDVTGLLIRETKPRVFVLASAGGAMSGALLDLGYGINRLMGQLKVAPVVSAYLFLGAPADPTTSAEECANLYATLTELNHYAEESITFRARYGGPDGPEVVSNSKPFQSVYLMQRGSRSPNAMTDAAGRLAAYLSLDMTTPLGGDLDRPRGSGSSEAMFRGFGTSGLWFPRGLLLRSAARQVCERLVQQWQASSSAIPPSVEEMCRRALNDPDLKPESLTNAIDLAVKSTDGLPGDPVSGLLGTLENKIPSMENAPGVWARDAFDQTLNLVGVKGSLDPADSVKTGRLAKMYATAVNDVTDLWAKRLGGEGMTALEAPGKRVAAAEAALSRLIDFAERGEVEATRNSSDYTRRSEQAYATARAAAEVCLHGGGFSLFGNRASKSMKSLLGSLTNYCQRRVEEEAQSALIRFYRRLKATLEDRQRDLSICRQRLTHLRRALEVPETAGASLGMGAGANVELLLPDGVGEIGWAAKQFVEGLKPEHYIEIDRALQNLILDPRGGLYGACQKSGEAIQELADPLIDQTAAFLSNLLPMNDVTDFRLKEAGGWMAKLHQCHDRAVPSVASTPENELWYLLIPESAGGDLIATEASTAFPGAKVVRASRSNEITFCRETRLRLEEIRTTLEFCKEAYDKLTRSPAHSPHARFDVVEWLPLEV